MKELLSIKLIENEAGEIELKIDPNDVTGQRLDQLMSALSHARSQLLPPVPEELTSLETEGVASLTRWFVGAAFPHGPVLGLRHPGKGWSVYQLPENLPEQLREALLALPQMYSQGGKGH